MHRGHRVERRGRAVEGRRRHVPRRQEGDEVQLAVHAERARAEELVGELEGHAQCHVPVREGIGREGGLITGYN